MLDAALGIPSEYRSREETLYFDETDNIKQVRITEKKDLNIKEKLNACFVLGGISTEETISLSELYGIMGKHNNKELKSSSDLQKDFPGLMKNQKVEKMLDLIYSRRWCVHFIMVQPIYYSFVDIIDSLFDSNMDTRSLKSVFYRILKSNEDYSIPIFIRYQYPSIQKSDVESFLKELILIADSYVKLHDISLNERLLIDDLVLQMNEVISSNKELVLLPNEKTNIWVEPFTFFYRTIIAMYQFKNLKFDQEIQVERQIKENPIIVNGEKLSNYTFVESTNEPMIQICDYVVAIMKKYFVFLDRETNLIEEDIRNFDATQLSNFMIFNSLLLYSKNYNPLFFHYISDIRIPQMVDNYMLRYGT